MKNAKDIALFPVPMLAVLLLGGHALAAPFVVDGNVSDWGISVADNNASQLTPSIPLLYYAKEDQDDNAGDGGFLGPNHGGQNYDVEFLGIAVQGSRIYFALVSGLRPDNGFQRYGPGDIRMKVNGNSYGIEVGGGAGGGAGDAITGGADGATYTLNGSGFTTAHNVPAGQTAGSIWSNPSWIMDPIAPQTPVQIQGGTYVGPADYVYTRNSATGQHSIIEGSFAASLFGGISSIELEWGPSCGNDVLAGLGLINIPNDQVPEPGALSLLALGLAGFAVRRRRPGQSA